MLRLSLLVILAWIEVAGQPVRVQLVTGGHPYDPAFYRLFEDPRLAAVVNPHPSAYRRDMTPQFDVLVLYDLVQVADVDERGRTNLQKFIEAGKGVVVLHHALADFNDWNWWVEEVVGAAYWMRPRGERPKSEFRQGELVVLTKSADHPISAGLEGTRFPGEETYSKMWFSPGAKVFLRNGKEPLAWTGPHSKARVVCIQSGHAKETLTSEQYKRLVTNAVLWASGREVSK